MAQTLDWRTLQTLLVHLDILPIIQILDKDATYDKEFYLKEINFTQSSNDYAFRINGQRYYLRNKSNKKIYGIEDVIALAKAAGRSDGEIANALNATKIPNALDHHGWDTSSVAAVNQATTDSAKKLQSYVTKNYKDINAHVDVYLNPDGKSYTYYIKYTDPSTGEVFPVKLENISDRLDDAELQSLLGPQTTVGGALNKLRNESKNALANAEEQEKFAKTVTDKLENLAPNLGVNAHQALSDADREIIRANLPNTEDLRIWNKTNDQPIFDKLIANLKISNPAILEKLGLDPNDPKLAGNDLIKRLDLKTLEGVSDAITEEQQNVTQRNISKQKIDVLKAIAQDPELYNKITQQARADNAVGTIVGQRAANAQAIANEADVGYDKQASDLYANLFRGENGNVAQQTYSSVADDKANTLDQYIQGQLDAAGATVAEDAATVQNLTTLLTALGAARGVDASTWLNNIAEEQAKAGVATNKLIGDRTDDVTGKLEADQVTLNTIIDMVNKFKGYANGAEGGSANVVDPMKAFNDFINGLGVNRYNVDYGKVNPGEYTSSKKFDNAQYNALADDPEFIKWLLSNNTIDAFTKAQTIDEFKNTYGLDMLSQAGLNELYGKYNTEATQEANKVFNTAQRAYIAAITAGDAKTADQLTKLAITAGASKGNLYAASALANQFKQQTGNYGSQLATDFLNQQSFNRSNAANVVRQTDAALGKYLGNGNDSYDAATLYGIFNKDIQNKANAFKAYGDFGNTAMGHTQDMNSGIVKFDIDNYERLGEAAREIQALNAAAGKSNANNKGTLDSIYVDADSLKRSTRTVKNSFKTP